jgi:hypothetical protein
MSQHYYLYDSIGKYNRKILNLVSCNTNFIISEFDTLFPINEKHKNINSLTKFLDNFYDSYKLYINTVNSILYTFNFNDMYSRLVAKTEKVKITIPKFTSINIDNPFIYLPEKCQKIPIKTFVKYENNIIDLNIQTLGKLMELPENIKTLLETQENLLENKDRNGLLFKILRLNQAYYILILKYYDVDTLLKLSFIRYKEKYFSSYKSIFDAQITRINFS